VSSLSSPPSDRRFECLPAGTRRKVLDCVKACRPMPTFTGGPCGPASTALPSTPGVGAGTGRRCTTRLFSTWPSRSRPSAARRCQRAPAEDSSVLWRGVGSDAKELLGVRTPEPGNHGGDLPRGGVTGHRDAVRLLRLGEELELAARVVSIRNMERGTDLLLLLDPADRDDLVAFLAVCSAKGDPGNSPMRAAPVGLVTAAPEVCVQLLRRTLDSGRSPVSRRSPRMTPSHRPWGV